MFNVLSIGKTGLNSMQKKVDSIADDLANVNTYGYKRKEISFRELLVNEISNNEVLKSANVNHGAINAGSKSEVGTINFKQGSMIKSAGDFHLAIEGEGFFGIRDKDGNLMLTRNGGFHSNGDNTVSDDRGYLLDIDFYVPFQQWESGSPSISKNGEITMDLNGQREVVGKIILYNPERLDSLISLGEGRYGFPQNTILNSSLNGGEFGSIVQHTLESSNVEISKSITEMIVAQRSYSLNAKGIQTTDDIMSMINNIK